MSPVNPSQVAPKTNLAELEDLSLSFKETGKTAFREINLTLKTDEIVAIIGPSGCGKSTLLKSVSGLLTPTKGGIRWKNERMPELAYIFQDPTLLPWLTAMGNVEVPLKLRGTPKLIREKRSKKAMQEVLLKEYARYYPKSLSGGMRMRVSLARALTLDPQLLFLDEPFGALDAMTRNQMNQLVLDLQRELGWSAWMVTHSVMEAVYMADRVCVMTPAPGTILETIPIDLPRIRTIDLQSDPAFLEYVSYIRNLIGREEL